MKVFFTIFIAISLVTAGHAQNLLTNPGFETGTQGWAVGVYESATVTLSHTTTEPNTGPGAAKVDVTATDGTHWHAQFIAAGTNIISVVSGKTYELRFWAKSNSARDNALEVAVAQPNPYEAIGGTSSLSTTNTWTEYVHTFTPLATYGEARITITCGKFVETYFFDDFILREVKGDTGTVGGPNAQTKVKLIAAPYTDTGGSTISIPVNTKLDSISNNPGAFGVKADGSVVPVSNASLNTTGDTVSVSLGNNVSSGQLVELSYADTLMGGLPVSPFTSPVINLVSGPDLLKNPGFEADTQNWALGAFASVTATLSRVTDPHSGTASAKVEVTATDGTHWHAQFLADAGNIIPVSSGKTYELRFWAKSTSPRDSSLDISVAQPNPFEVIGSTTTVSTTGAWTEYVHTFTAQADFLEARITISCGKYVEAYFFDDFTLRDVTPEKGAHGDIYYVANIGDDNNPGIRSAPFKTIQKALEKMQPGDVANIYPGIYREAVTSVRSGTSALPIKLEAVPGGDVVITATDHITGWSVHQGVVYKAPVNNEVMQLFVFGSSAYDFSLAPRLDPGELMTEARYPNLITTKNGLFETPEDGNFTSMARSGATITVTGLPAGDYTGAKLYAYATNSSNRWWSHTADILSNSGNTVTGSAETLGPWLANNISGYVAGPLQLLDAPKEWSYDGSSLYFWAANDGNPNDLHVEAKTRGYVVQISHDHITLEGIKTFGGGIWIAGGHNKLTNMDMRYLDNQLTWGWSHIDRASPPSNPTAGLRIRGNNNELSNSKLYYCGAEGITLNGNHNIVNNNDISYTSYYGHFMHSVHLVGDDNTVVGNNIAHGGKSHIRIHHGGGNAAERFRVLYNNISENGYVNHDIGMIVAWGAHTKGAEIAYNWIHDNYSTSIAGGNHGIYLDNNNQGLLIHHNVIWNIRGNNIRFNSPQYDIHVYNNTLGKCDQNIGDGVYFNNTLGLNDELVNCNFKNNYMIRDITFDPKYPVVRSNNVKNTDESAFDHPAFMISSSSMAVDQGIFLDSIHFGAGVSYPPVTRFVTDGTPDAGAYEAGGIKWEPGIDRIENEGSPLGSAASVLRMPYKVKPFISYPNPVSDVLVIRLPGHTDQGEKMIRVMNINGKTIKSIPVAGTTFSLDMRNFMSGIYLIRVEQKDSVLVSRVLKE